VSQRAPVREHRQRDISALLDLAVSDDRIKAVVLDLDRFMGGGQPALPRWASGSMRSRAGKPVYAFATAYSDDGYQLAAHASEIWLDPMGGVLPTGPGGSRTYYKGLFEQLGIKAHIYRVGTFKSAVEPYMRADQSPDAKAAMPRHCMMWCGANGATDVAKARPKAQLDAKCCRCPAAVKSKRPKAIWRSWRLSNGLVDKLGDKVAFGKYVAAKIGETAKNVPAISPQRGLKHCSPRMARRHDGDPIGVVTISQAKSSTARAAGRRLRVIAFQRTDLQARSNMTS
jgi:protease-4